MPRLGRVTAGLRGRVGGRAPPSRGRHRRRTPLARRLATAVLVAAALAVSALVAVAAVSGPGDVAGVVTPDVPEARPLVAAPPSPTPPAAAPPAEPASPVGAPTAKPPTTTAPPTPPTPALTCEDFRDGPSAQAALDADRGLAARLDTDRDGLACEARFRKAPTATPPKDGAAPKDAAPGTACPSELAGTLPHVARAGHHLAQRFDIPNSAIGGRAERVRAGSDHPLGLALDFTVDRATGDAVAEYAVAHRAELGITYVIFRQMIDTGSGWKPMESRGDPTADHFDHVHASFRPDPPADAPLCEPGGTP